MSYASRQDMIDRFGHTEMVQITNPETPEALEIDVQRLEQAFVDADAEIDSYLQGRYALPLASVPLGLKRNACDIARYHLFGNRVTDVVETRYKTAIAFFKSVAKGEIKLSLDSSQQATPTTGGPKVDGPGRTFSKDSLSDFNG